MAEITKKFPNSMITGDDLTVTNNKILTKAVDVKSCNAAILKVNQAGSLYDALEFAKVANQNNIKLITSHRSGESSDSHISHIGIGTGSKLLKVGIVGGERVEKVNELIRISEHDLIHGMIDFLKIAMSQQTETTDLKKKVLATGIRVGTDMKTKSMRPFITSASPEGLYMIDIDITLAKIKSAAKWASGFDMKKVIVCSGKEYATTPIEKFVELTGASQMLRRFMPGTLTNPSLPYFIEPQLIIISDPEVDGQAIIEATNAGIPVIGISNTNNVTSNLDLIIPANNRGRKALATIYWLLAREILIQKGELKEDQDMKYEIDDFETKIEEEL